MVIQDVYDVFNKWLYLEGTAAIDVHLGTIIANLMEGDPVWTLLVAPPGSGKTEIIQSTSSLSFIESVGTLTEASFLSGSAKSMRDSNSTGGILKKIGEKGIISVAEFSSILATSQDRRGPVLAALRSIYDGKWERHFGVDGGKSEVWEGKCGMVGGATSSIDQHYGAMASLGDRFLFYRFDAKARKRIGESSILLNGKEAAMRRELTDASHLFVSSINTSKQVSVSQQTVDYIVNLSLLVTQCRTGVDRDSAREIIMKPLLESPGRVAKSLIMLMKAFHLMGVEKRHAKDVIREVALSSMPYMRRMVIEAVIDRPLFTRGSIARVLRAPETTIKRVIEDLYVCDCVEYVEGSDEWKITDGLKNLWKA